MLISIGEDGRPTGWSPADPSRRRNSGPLINSGSLSKQKSPVANDPVVSKDTMVSVFYCSESWEFSLMLLLITMSSTIKLYIDIVVLDLLLVLNFHEFVLSIL